MINGASEILARAREILEIKGWIQGHFATKDGVCLTRALNEAQHELHFGYITRIGSRTAIYSVISHNNIIGWNDTPGRTYEEVIQLLKEAERETTSRAGGKK